jgi:hypothetical protein
MSLLIKAGNKIRTAVAWDMYLLDNVPALDKLWSQGKFEQFETYKSLAGLTYKDYVEKNKNRFDTSIFYAPYIPIEFTNVEFTVTK